jgi:hypothetical protein
MDGVEAGVSVARLPGFSPDGPLGNPFPALHQPQKPLHRAVDLARALRPHP